MLRDWLIPRILYRGSSTMNHDIRVVKHGRDVKLLVGGSRQSGRYIQMLWQKSFRAFGIKERAIRDILVLGIGGGTAIKLLSDMFPEAHIDAVDIDETMIDIARKYFALDTIAHLSVHTHDASEFVKRKKKQYDLIVLDVFHGREIPAFVLDTGFQQNLRNLMHSSGSLCINYLQERSYEHKSDTLFDLLRSIYRDVQDYRIERNRFFFCTTG